MNYALEASQMDLLEVPKTENRFARAWRETKAEFDEFKADFDREGGLLMISMVVKLTGVSRVRIHQFLDEGRLTRFEHFDLTYVSKREILAWLNSERDKGGRPPKEA